MPVAQLRPNERYALVGKTRSGKTALAMVLASTFAQALASSDDRWQVWWVDTKHDNKDLASLRKWGFRNAASYEDMQSVGSLGNALYFRIATRDGEGRDLETVEQVQFLLRKAYERKHVIVVIDEYVQAVPSPRNAGKALLDIFQRGGGLNVGLIGLTQEPVYVPRQLLSQATHLVMFSLTHRYDVEYMHKMESAYQVPMKLGDPYGFWWKHVDGSGEVIYYPNQRVWYDNLHVAMPNTLKPETEAISA
jgi:hypothetical protein